MKRNIIKEYLEKLDQPTFSPEQIAQKHNVPVEYILSQLELGLEVESEHSTDQRICQEIALDHLMERPDYYSKLLEMEKND